MSMHDCEYDCGLKDCRAPKLTVPDTILASHRNDIIDEVIKAIQIPTAPSRWYRDQVVKAIEALRN